MEIAKRRPVSPDLNIAPLIDVVFLLLLFFILTSNYVKEQSIELSLPQSEHGAPQEDQVLRVEVVSADEIIIDGERLSWESAPAVLAERKRSQVNPEQPVLLRIEQAAEVQLLVSAMDLLRGAGFEQIALASEQRSSSVSERVARQER